ncbi:MAG TPA: hypothetical protein VFB14_04895 [Bryobacteraceae bacterium]|nr:hypothetical protein [Bryobacteraceae bacterium]
MPIRKNQDNVRLVPIACPKMRKTQTELLRDFEAFSAGQMRI